MMRALLSIVFTWLAGLVPLQAGQPLIVGMELTYPPFEFVNEDGLEVSCLFIFYIRS